MEKEDTISVQWAQEGVETSYNLLNNNKMASHRDSNSYQTHHNLTTADEGASIFGYANGGPLKKCDFQMHTRDPDGHMIKLSIDSPHFDPMMYVLFYP